MHCSSPAMGKKISHKVIEEKREWLKVESLYAQRSLKRKGDAVAID